MRPEFQSSGTEKITELPGGASHPVGYDGVDVPAPVKNYHARSVESQTFDRLLAYSRPAEYDS